jgi:anti-sigma factor RsiW
MNCNEAATLVAAHADGEIDRLRAHSLAKHLRGCAQCAERHEAVLALRRRLHAEIEYHLAPPALKQRVLSAISAAQPSVAFESPRPISRWRWMGAGALSGCAVTVFAWLIGSALIDAHARDDLAAEATVAHVRATLSSRLVEVASSDQHTVKPWLSARLDYSPPVHDMATSGFTLVGGRLDYLSGQHVATLVYRYRDHMVDVFVRPRTAASTEPVLRTLRGFNVARASGAAFDWIAVSDVSADALSPFIEALAREQ